MFNKKKNNRIDITNILLETQNSSISAIENYNKNIWNSNDIDTIHKYSESMVKEIKNLKDFTNNIEYLLKLNENEIVLNTNEYDIKDIYNDLVNCIYKKINVQSIEFKQTVIDGTTNNVIIDKKEIVTGFSKLVNYVIETNSSNKIGLVIKNEVSSSKCKTIIKLKHTNNATNVIEIFDILNKAMIINKKEYYDLITAKKVVELYGGKLSVMFAENKELEYTIEFTTKNGHKKQEEKLVQDEERQYKDYTGKKILVVDDVKLNIKIATRILNKYNIEVDSALSGDECLEKVKNNKYDLIFLDYMMPGLDGIRTMKNLKRNNLQTKIICLTSDAKEGRDILFKSEGFDDFLAKPIEINAMDSILEKYL